VSDVRIVLQPGDRLIVEIAPLPSPAVARETLTLPEVVAKYGGSIRLLRDAIKRGHLPAAKRGRGFLVRVEDAAKFFAPKLRPTDAAPPGSDESIMAQLRAKGIRFAGDHQGGG